MLPNCPKCNSEYTYEDGNLLIVNKPMGLLTQKDSPDSHSLADEVLYYLKENTLGLNVVYSDEYSDNFVEQCRAMNGFGIPYIEIRHADGKNISEMTKEDVLEMVKKLKDII